jgi:hypothetical protein
MSKKRFSSGLDDLFNDNDSVQQAEMSTMYSGGEAATSPFVRIERKNNTKNFVSDLDALLQEAIDESFEKYETRTGGIASGKSKSTAISFTPAPNRAPLSGLDALFRETIDVREMGTDELGKKRLTVAVDKPKLEKLKTIARMENSFLKDILTSLIDEYISEYTNKKGVDL